MLSSKERSERTSLVEGIEIELLTVTGIPLGFQRTDHERDHVRQRPDHGQVGPESRKGLRARDDPMMGQVCRGDLIQPLAKGWE